MESTVIEELQQFIDQSPTAFHAVTNVKEILQQNQFIQVYENAIWELRPGGKYFVIRNDASIMAFTIPDKPVVGFRIFAAHSDSPAFKIKCKPDMKAENTYVKLNTEKYGGMIMATWLDRPLSIAGRVTLNRKRQEQDTYQTLSSHGDLENVLVHFEKNMCVIPNVAIHMNRDMNQSLSYNPQVDMLPLVALQSEESDEMFSLNKEIAELLGISQDEIAGSELYLYNREKACLAGAGEEFLLAPRLDDLECVFTGLQGFLQAKADNHINVLAVFHNEEVGSLTRQGADSTFLKDTLANIVEGLTEDDFEVCRKKKNQVARDKILRILVDESFFMSADNAHAAHPNHGEKADPTNRPLLNGGIVLKFHGAQKYATDSYAEAVVRKTARTANVPVQTYCNRSDIAGGSTLGNISMAQVSMPAADIGLAQLAMHSAYETAGSKDIEYMIAFAKAFYAQ